jgi:molybdate transport system permease protein
MDEMQGAPSRRGGTARVRGTTQQIAIWAPGPRLLFLPAGLGLILVTLPVLCLPRGVSLSGMPALLGSSTAQDALWLSVKTTTAATLLSLLLGVPLALVLVRSRLKGIIRGLLLMPLTLPPVVGGMALLSAFGRRGLLGSWLEVAGVRIAFTTTAVVLAQSFVALPFFVLALSSALASAGDEPERAAAGLGARPWQVLWWVTLPRLRPALISATALAFARALGEFGATLTFAGSFQGVTRTLPLEVYLQREVDPQAAQALSLAFLLVAVVLVLLTLAADRRRVEPVA